MWHAKWISLCLVLCMFVNQTLYGNVPPANPVVSNEVQTQSSHSDFPKTWTEKISGYGTVSAQHVFGKDMSVFETGSDASQKLSKLLIYIEDAHGNISAQKNIANLIHAIASEKQIDVPWIALEGTEPGEIDHRALSMFPDSNVRTLVADYFVHRGEMDGADYYTAHFNPKSRHFGVDSLILAEKNRQAYREFLEIRERVDSVLKRFQYAAGVLKKKTYFGDLVEFDRIVEQFRKKPRDIPKYLDRLVQFAEKENVNLEKFEGLQLLFKLRELERSQNSIALNSERQKYQTQFQETLHNPMILSKWEENSKVFEAFPELEKQAELLHHYELLKNSSAFEEVEILISELWRALLKHKEAKDTHEVIRILNFYQKLFQFSLLPRDYQAYINAPEDWSLKGIQKTFKKYRFLLRPKQMRPVKKEYAYLNRAIQQALTFYETAHERNEPIVQNVKELVEGNPNEVTFLVAGGFHREELLESFKENQISFVVLTPKINSFAGQENYWRLMGGDESGLQVGRISDFLNEQPTAAGFVAAQQAKLRAGWPMRGGTTGTTSLGVRRHFDFSLKTALIAAVIARTNTDALSQDVLAQYVDQFRIAYPDFPGLDRVLQAVQTSPEGWSTVRTGESVDYVIYTGPRDTVGESPVDLTKFEKVEEAFFGDIDFKVVVYRNRDFDPASISQRNESRTKLAPGDADVETSKDGEVALVRERDEAPVEQFQTFLQSFAPRINDLQKQQRNQGFQLDQNVWKSIMRDILPNYLKGGDRKLELETVAQAFVEKFEKVNADLSVGEYSRGFDAAGIDSVQAGQESTLRIQVDEDVLSGMNREMSATQPRPLMAEAVLAAYVYYYFIDPVTGLDEAGRPTRTFNFIALIVRSYRKSKGNYYQQLLQGIKEDDSTKKAMYAIIAGQAKKMMGEYPVTHADFLLKLIAEQFGRIGGEIPDDPAHGQSIELRVDEPVDGGTGQQTFDGTVEYTPGQSEVENLTDGQTVNVDMTNQGDGTLAGLAEGSRQGAFPVPETEKPADQEPPKGASLAATGARPKPAAAKAAPADQSGQPASAGPASSSPSAASISRSQLFGAADSDDASGSRQDEASQYAQSRVGIFTEAPPRAPTNAMVGGEIAVEPIAFEEGKYQFSPGQFVGQSNFKQRYEIVDAEPMEIIPKGEGDAEHYVELWRVKDHKPEIPRANGEDVYKYIKVQKWEIQHDGSDKGNVLIEAKRLLLNKYPVERGIFFARSRHGNKYRIMHDVAAGGFGEIWKVVDVEFRNRELALKVVWPREEVEDREESNRRSAAEVAASEEVGNSQIPDVPYHVAHEGLLSSEATQQEMSGAYSGEGEGYLMLRWAPGRSLSSAVKNAKRENARMSADDVTHVGLRASRVLHNFWTRLKRVHRDIKPDNINVGRKQVDPSDRYTVKDLSVRVLDLGMSRVSTDIETVSDDDVEPKFVESAAGATISVGGRIMGTVDYMSPEQILNFSKVDIRSDIYSLGATLYYALSGGIAPVAWRTKDQLVEDDSKRRVFEKIDRHQRGEFFNPSAYDESIKGTPLEYIVLKMMAPLSISEDDLGLLREEGKVDAEIEEVKRQLEPVNGQISELRSTEQKARTQIKLRERKQKTLPEEIQKLEVLIEKLPRDAQARAEEIPALQEVYDALVAERARREAAKERVGDLAIQISDAKLPLDGAKAAVAEAEKRVAELKPQKEELEEELAGLEEGIEKWKTAGEQAHQGVLQLEVKRHQLELEEARFKFLREGVIRVDARGNPLQRYQTTAELLEDLEALEKGTPLPSAREAGLFSEQLGDYDYNIGILQRAENNVISDSVLLDLSQDSDVVGSLSTMMSRGPETAEDAFQQRKWSPVEVDDAFELKFPQVAQMYKDQKLQEEKDAAARTRRNFILLVAAVLLTGGIALIYFFVLAPRFKWWPYIEDLVLAKDIPKEPIVTDDRNLVKFKLIVEGEERDIELPLRNLKNGQYVMPYTVKSEDGSRQQEISVPVHVNAIIPGPEVEVLEDPVTTKDPRRAVAKIKVDGVAKDRVLNLPENLKVGQPVKVKFKEENEEGGVTEAEVVVNFDPEGEVKWDGTLRGFQGLAPSKDDPDGALLLVGDAERAYRENQMAYYVQQEDRDPLRGQSWIYRTTLGRARQANWLLMNREQYAFHADENVSTRFSTVFRIKTVDGVRRGSGALGLRGAFSDDAVDEGNANEIAFAVAAAFRADDDARGIAIDEEVVVTPGETTVQQYFDQIQEKKNVGPLPPYLNDQLVDTYGEESVHVEFYKPAKGETVDGQVYNGDVVIVYFLQFKNDSGNKLPKPIKKQVGTFKIKPGQSYQPVYYTSGVERATKIGNIKVEHKKRDGLQEAAPIEVEVPEENEGAALVAPAVTTVVANEQARPFQSGQSGTRRDLLRPFLDSTREALDSISRAESREAVVSELTSEQQGVIASSELAAGSPNGGLIVMPARFLDAVVGDLDTFLEDRQVPLQNTRIVFVVGPGEDEDEFLARYDVDRLGIYGMTIVKSNTPVSQMEAAMPSNGQRQDALDSLLGKVATFFNVPIGDLGRPVLMEETFEVAPDARDLNYLEAVHVPVDLAKLEAEAPYRMAYLVTGTALSKKTDNQINGVVRNADGSIRLVAELVRAFAVKFQTVLRLARSA